MSWFGSTTGQTLRRQLTDPFCRKSVVDAEDVVLAVLEPSGLPHVSHGGNVVVPLDTRHVVVVLERTPLALEVPHRRIDVIDMPLSECVPGLPGVVGLVDAEC